MVGRPWWDVRGDINFRHPLEEGGHASDTGDAYLSGDKCTYIIISTINKVTHHVWGDEGASCMVGGKDEGGTVDHRDGDDERTLPPWLPDDRGEVEEGGHVQSPRHVVVHLFHASFSL